MEWCRAWQTALHDQEIRDELQTLRREADVSCQELRALDVIFWTEMEIRNGNMVGLCPLVVPKATTDLVSAF